MSEQKPAWTQEEEEFLALCVITALSEGKRIADGIKTFIQESNFGRKRTEATCHWKWSNEVRHRYAKELEQIGHPIKRIKKEKKQPEANNSELVNRPNVETQESPIDSFFRAFEKMVHEVKFFQEEYNRLLAENKMLREALEKARNEVNTFIKAFQIARPYAIEGIPESVEARIKVNNRGEVEEVEISAERQS
jgi:RsfA family transcription factor